MVIKAMYTFLTFLAMLAAFLYKSLQDTSSINSGQQLIRGFMQWLLRKQSCKNDIASATLGKRNISSYTMIMS